MTRGSNRPSAAPDATSSALGPCGLFARETAQPRHAVRHLLHLAAEEFGGEAEFYSAPTGRGRSVVVKGQSDARRAGFILVATSRGRIQRERPSSTSRKSSGCGGALLGLGNLAEGEALDALQAAVERGAAAAGRTAAAAVRTPSGLEGMLLVRVGTPLPPVSPRAACPHPAEGSRDLAARAASLKRSAGLLQDEAQRLAHELPAARRRSVEEAAIKQARMRDIAARMSEVTAEYVALLKAHPNAVESDGSAPASLDAIVLLPQLRAYALALAERLDKIRWRQEAEAAQHAFESALASLERIAAREGCGDVVGAAHDMLPHQVLRGGVSLDRVALWVHDVEAEEMVLNTSGQLDGARVPVKDSLVGAPVLAGRLGQPDVFCFPDVRAETPHPSEGFPDQASGYACLSAICVPIAPRLGTPARRHSLLGDAGEVEVGASVVQFSSGRRLSCVSGAQDVQPPAAGSAGTGPDHFDLAAAEALRTSALLPTALQVRRCLLQLLELERQREGLQMVCADLGLATTVKDVVHVVESQFPKTMDCEYCTLFFVDEERHEIWALQSQSHPEGIRIRIGEGVAGHVAKEALRNPNKKGLALIANTPSACPHWVQSHMNGGFVTRNILTVPVWSNTTKDARLLGLVQVLNKRRQQGRSGSVGGESARASSRNSAQLQAVLEEGAYSSDEDDDDWREVGGDEDEDEDDAPGRGGVFTRGDAELLEVLARACGEKLHSLLLDMMWTKARMDTDAEQEETPSIVQEYYTMLELGVRKTVKSTQGDNLAKRLAVVPPQAEMPSPRRPPVLDEDGLPVAAGHRQGEFGPRRGAVRGGSIGAQENANVRNWKVDYWGLTEPEQFSLLLEALRRLEGVSSKLSVPPQALHGFFLGVKGTYLDNPYHNFHHAMSAMHYSFKFIHACGVVPYLRGPDLFAVIIGAFIHDAGHRGKNNAFEVMSKSDIAICYNDNSPLENHSCAVAFQLALSSSPNGGVSPRQGVSRNIFMEMSPEDYATVRRRMVAGVLSTDMRHHGQHVQQMQDFKLLPEVNEAQSQFLVELILHAADIGNPLMPPALASRWSRCIAEEFALQADAERKCGLPVTGFMACMREPAAAAKSQLGFIDFVINPLFNPMFRVFPGLAEPRGFLEENREVAARALAAIEEQSSTAAAGHS